MTDELNPYRPPTAQVELTPEAGHEMALAGKGRRFCTLLIDYVGYYLVSFLIGLGMFFAAGPASLEALRGGWRFVYGLVLIIVYYLFFEGLWQRTPGKMILGTRVVDENGGVPAFGTIVKRTLARCVPFEAFTFFGERGFHDKASGTRVVRTR